MTEIVINISSHQGYSEIDISGTVAEFASLVNHLIKTPTGVLPLKNMANVYFPIPVSALLTELVEHSNGLIKAHTYGDYLKISGDSKAFQKLINFLESLSNLSPGEHFHLDWFGNENLLDPTTSNMSFIFSMNA